MHYCETVFFSSATVNYLFPNEPNIFQVNNLSVHILNVFFLFLLNGRMNLLQLILIYEVAPCPCSFHLCPLELGWFCIPKNLTVKISSPFYHFKICDLTVICLKDIWFLFLFVCHKKKGSNIYVMWRHHSKFWIEETVKVFGIFYSKYLNFWFDLSLSPMEKLGWGG